MTVVSIHMPEQTGQTGLTLFLRKTSDGTLVNTGGDGLSESPASSGRFTADVAEAWAETLAASVLNAASLTIRDGWLASGETIVRDSYPSAGGGGGAGDAEQATSLEILEAVDSIAVALAGGSPVEPTGVSETVMARLTRVEAQTSKLSGSPVTVNGNVKPGGQIVLKHGDNHLVSLLNSVPVPVDDVGGSLHTLMAAVGLNNIGVAAIRGSDPASRISGTVAALNYASNMLTVTMEFTAAESSKGVVGPVYTYDVYRLDNPTRTFFSGKLTVTRDARP